MPLASRLRQREGDAGAHPDGGRGLDAELLRHQVGGAEADAADVAGEAVGVLGDDLHGVGAVGLVDAHRSGGAHAVGVQEQHDLADHLLIRPAGDDAGGPLGSDPVTSRSRAGSCSIKFEHRRPERPHQLGGVDRADAADHARAEILLDALERGRRARLQEGGLELQAMGAVVDPSAAHLHPLAGCDRSGVPDDRDQVALPARLDPQHAKAGVGVVERHPLDQPGQRLHGWATVAQPTRNGVGQGRLTVPVPAGPAAATLAVTEAPASPRRRRTHRRTAIPSGCPPRTAPAWRGSRRR